VRLGLCRTSASRAIRQFRQLLFQAPKFTHARPNLSAALLDELQHPRMRRRVRLTIVFWLLPVVVAFALTGCGQHVSIRAPWDRPSPPAGVTLTDLHEISDLRSTFNQDVGKPRLVLLVSPT
jgi:hypothetical protein